LNELEFQTITLIKEYLGILHHIHTANVDIRSARQIPQVSETAARTAQLDELVNYFITTKTDLIITPDIYLFVSQTH